MEDAAEPWIRLVDDTCLVFSISFREISLLEVSDNSKLLVLGEKKKRANSKEWALRAFIRFPSRTPTYSVPQFAQMTARLMKCLILTPRQAANGRREPTLVTPSSASLTNESSEDNESSPKSVEPPARLAPMCPARSVSSLMRNLARPDSDLWRNTVWPTGSCKATAAWLLSSKTATSTSPSVAFRADLRSHWVRQRTRK